MKDLLGGTIKEMMEAEMSHHLGYKKSERSVYTAQDEPTAARIRDEVELKWSKKYPHAMKSWRMNWDAIVPIFKFSPTLRTIVYTTNAIESLNATYRQLNRQRSVFPNDNALLKALFLATELATKKWTIPLQNWGLIYGKLSIIFVGCLSF